MSLNKSGQQSVWEGEQLAGMGALKLLDDNMANRNQCVPRQIIYVVVSPPDFTPHFAGRP